MTSIPFARTACSCPSCQSCCRQQPGHLLPGQMGVIAAYLGKSVEAMARQPEAAGVVRGTMFIGIGLIEALALFGFVLSFII